MMANLHKAILDQCASHMGCYDCVKDSDCGYLYNVGSCVPGGWFEPHTNNSRSDHSWDYYHGNCYVSTRVEFILFPSIVAGLVLFGLIVIAWRYWTHRKFASCNVHYSYLDPGYESDENENAHRSQQHRHHYQYNNHTPLLIDNDPKSRPVYRHASTSSSLLHPTSASRPSARISINPDEPVCADNSQTGVSFEQQYGSWLQRNANIIQNTSSTQTN